MSYSQENRTYFFNTALTALPKDGEENQVAFTKAIEPLWLHIKSQDGVIGCYIKRYEVKVEFMTGVIDEAGLDEIMREAIEWAAARQNDDVHVFFPLRGEKTPEATRKQEQKILPAKLKVRAIFPNLVSYATASGSYGTFNTEKFLQLVAPLAIELGSAIGVLNCELTQTTADLTYDTRITTYDAVRKHINDVLFPKATNGAYFPLLDASTGLVIKFAYVELPNT